jgi:hypothetical protein
MKRTHAITGMLVLLFLVCIATMSVAPVVRAEDNAAGEEAFAVSSVIELKAPPEEALTVPRQETRPPTVPPIAVSVFVAIVLVPLSVFIARKRKVKVKVKRAAQIVAIVSTILPTLCFAGWIHVARASYDYGNPLDTSNIMLFAYYKDPSGWTLANTVPAFEAYTDHGNYYDGIVRVWMDQSSNTNFVGSEFYVDVCVRVRADGWILAWLTAGQSRAYIVFWGHSISSATPPVIGATAPSRAIQRVFYAAGKTFPGHTAINYYDFAHPTAKKLLIFGKCLQRKDTGTSTATFYYTFPAYVQILDAASSIAYHETVSGNSGSIKIDDTVFASLYANTYWHSLSLPSSALTLEVKHAVTISCYSASQGDYTRINLALIFWML